MCAQDDLTWFIHLKCVAQRLALSKPSVNSSHHYPSPSFIIRLVPATVSSSSSHLRPRNGDIKSLLQSPGYTGEAKWLIQGPAA